MSSSKNDRHLTWTRLRPCWICGNWIETEAAHVRMAFAAYGKQITGMQIKPRGPNGEECYVAALCSAHHREQHSAQREKRGEEAFWKRYGFSAEMVLGKCMAAWIYTGCSEAGDEIAKNRG